MKTSRAATPAAADNKQSAFMDALAFTFLWKELKKP